MFRSIIRILWDREHLFLICPISYIGLIYQNSQTGSQLALGGAFLSQMVQLFLILDDLRDDLHSAQSKVEIEEEHFRELTVEFNRLKGMNE